MEKQKNQSKQLQSLHIVILWAMIQAFGWGLIFVFVSYLENELPEYFLFGFIGLFAGGMMGALQSVLIDRGTGARLELWTPLTAIGTAVGFLLATADNAYQLPAYLYILPIFLVPAFLQWWSIREHTRAGWLWLGANVLANVFFVMFVWTFQDGTGEMLLSFVVPALLQGIVTGFTIVWLIRRLPSENAHKTEKVSYHEFVDAYNE